DRRAPAADAAGAVKETNWIVGGGLLTDCEERRPYDGSASSGGIEGRAVPTGWAGGSGSGVRRGAGAEGRAPRPGGSPPASDRATVAGGSGVDSMSPVAATEATLLRTLPAEERAFMSAEPTTEPSTAPRVQGPQLLTAIFDSNAIRALGSLERKRWD